MDSKSLWYEEMPEVFEREKQILESKGFYLNLINNRVEFIGRSSVLKEYPLRIIYPNGYPSFPPTVISDVKDDLILVRHQRKLNKVLCCFGFSSERWRADFTAREVLQEAEELIVNYSPITFNAEFLTDDDYVPEPIVNQYNYSGEGILIPSPFADLSFTEFKRENVGAMKYSRNQKRGILTSINIKKENTTVDDGYKEWFKSSTTYKTIIYKVSTPPPLTTAEIKPWLLRNKIRTNPKKTQFIFFVFEDEWRKTGNKRTAWLALKNVQGHASWVRCYLVSEDDSKIRTPYGYQLSEKVVSIVGAGCLGSIVATTLAQEGVKTFNLFDYDTYEPSNAIRHQVSQDWFGLPKVYGVSNRIRELSPKANVEPFP